jgi:hypothetical protein
MRNVLLLLVLSAAAVALPHSSNLRDAPDDKWTQEHSESRLTYKTVAQGELKDGDLRFGTTTYRASNGAVVTLIHRDFDSAPAATNYYMKKITGALKVIEEGTKTNKSGAPIGRRAQILTDLGTKGQSVPAVLWTDANHFFELTSYSIPTIRALETKLN